jgi:hypothetical protein
MLIQVNTDHNIAGREALVTSVQTTVQEALHRFSDHITRVEVHLSDENGSKHGANDKRCVMEARIEGHQPIAVTHEAETVQRSYSGAATKLKTALTSTVERLRARTV